nr:hypothetical protein [Tanacetum cinerariifolium]
MQCGNAYEENSHDNKLRPKDYTFKEWMIVKVGHIDVNESVKKALLKSWVIDCFEEALDPDKDPIKRGHILDMIWENCKNIQGKAKEWWYDYSLEDDEKQENGDKKYDPLMVHMETFELTRYSFDNENSFICVIDEIKDTLSLG